MRTCVIFNPTAKGNKARRFRRSLGGLASDCEFKPTTCAGDARRLAAEAVAEGYETVVAAGGDGTVNEALNGISTVPGGFDRVRLGVIPLGTVNVLARELGIPLRLTQAWEILRRGREMRVDLPRVVYSGEKTEQRVYFAQLAGAGLDARAVELVNWELKKRIGPLAYVLAGLRALCGPLAKIEAVGDSVRAEGRLVLVGNGRLYGGNYRIFPQADMTDGLLDVCVFPRANWFTLAWCGSWLLLRGCLPRSSTCNFQTRILKLRSAGRVPFELDGELVGTLPVEFSLEPLRLRVVTPGPT